eukprot:2228027-Rhodomonas_salina.2
MDLAEDEKGLYSASVLNVRSAGEGVGAEREERHGHCEKDIQDDDPDRGQSCKNLREVERCALGIGPMEESGEAPFSGDETVHGDEQPETPRSISGC